MLTQPIRQNLLRRDYHAKAADASAAKRVATQAVAFAQADTCAPIRDLAMTAVGHAVRLAHLALDAAYAYGNAVNDSDAAVALRVIFAAQDAVKAADALTV